MERICDNCICLDKKQKKQKGNIFLYYCDKYHTWRTPSQEACDGMLEKNACYLTSACVRHKGLPDDCEQLSILRQYRDGYLKTRQDGRALIEEYYRTAPLLVSKIEHHRNKSNIYEYIFTQITHCVQAIKKGNNEVALLQYLEMTHAVEKMAQR